MLSWLRTHISSLFSQHFFFVFKCTSPDFTSRLPYYYQFSFPSPLALIRPQLSIFSSHSPFFSHHFLQMLGMGLFLRITIIPISTTLTHNFLFLIPPTDLPIVLHSTHSLHPFTLTLLFYIHSHILSTASDELQTHHRSFILQLKPTINIFNHTILSANDRIEPLTRWNLAMLLLSQQNVMRLE